MGNRKFYIVISLLLAIAVIPLGNGYARAQSDAALEKSDKTAVMERMRDRAERVQELRKARISHADRQAAAARAKAARQKGNEAPEKAAPVQNGKRGTK